MYELSFGRAPSQQWRSFGSEKPACRELTILRAAACAKPSLDEVSYEERVHRLEAYLRLLHNFVDKVGHHIQPCRQNTPIVPVTTKV